MPILQNSRWTLSHVLEPSCINHHTSHDYRGSIAASMIKTSLSLGLILIVISPRLYICWFNLRICYNYCSLNSRTVLLSTVTTAFISLQLIWCLFTLVHLAWILCCSCPIHWILPLFIYLIFILNWFQLYILYCISLNSFYIFWKKIHDYFQIFLCFAFL